MVDFLNIFPILTSPHEILLIILSIGIFIFNFYKILEEKEKFLNSILIFFGCLVIFFAISESGNYFTIDAPGILLETYDIENSPLYNWHHRTSFRFSNVVIGITNILLTQNVTFENTIENWSILKSLKSFIAVVLLLVFVCLMHKDKQKRLMFFVLVGSISIFLAISKIFNYDGFSLQFILISFAALKRGVEENKNRYLYISLITSGIAINEKMSANIFFLAISFAIVVFAFYKYIEEKNKKKSILLLLTVPIIPFFITLLFISIMKYIIGNPNLSITNYQLLFPQASSLFSASLSFLKLNELEVVLTNKSNKLILNQFIIQYIFIYFFGFLTVKVYLHNSFSDFFKNTHEKLSLNIWKIAVLFLISGYISSYFVQSYIVHIDWENFKEIQSKYFLHNLVFNEAIIHFNSTNVLEHYTKSILNSFAVFSLHISWLFWIVLIFLIFKKTSSSLLELFFILLCLMVPVLFAITNYPVTGKYLSIPIVLFISITLNNFLEKINYSKYKYLSIVLIFLSFIELSIYYPSFYSYRHIAYWNNNNVDIPVKSELDSIWNGWGEDGYLTYKKLLKFKTFETGPINIYNTYLGEAYITQPNINYYPYIGYLKSEELSFGVNDYYIFTRSSVAQGVPFPEKVKPEFTISFRGYPQSWIFRGDKLKEKNFTPKYSSIEKKY